MAVSTYVYVYVLPLCLTINMCFPKVSSTQMLDLYWNATSSMFRIDNTDHILDVNAGNHPWEYDQVNLVCPVYKPGTDEKMQEKYIIYSVSKQEYDSCRITQANPRIVAVCNQPHNLMYFTITFRSFTPTPGGMEFKPGQDYYFISTSSKSDLHRRVGGACSSKNMKLIFKVASDTNDSIRNRENIIVSNRSNKIDTFTKLAKQTKHQQPNPILIDYQKRFKMIKEAKKKIRNYSRSSKHNSNESQNAQVLYYPWREMIQERTGYFSSSGEVYNSGNSRENTHKYSKIVQTPKLSSSAVCMSKVNLYSNLFVNCVILYTYYLITHIR